MKNQLKIAILLWQFGLIATLTSFMAMSAGATMTDAATSATVGGTLASFIGHMKAVIEKSKNNTGKSNNMCKTYKGQIHRS